MLVPQCWTEEEVKAAFAEHSLLVAILLDRKEQVTEHLAKGAASARDGRGRTALLLACVHGHESAAALLAEPSQAAGVLDAVGDDGVSALLWAEERGWGSVAQKLRECGAAAVRRPALSLFRGKRGAVQIKVTERTVAFVRMLSSVCCLFRANFRTARYKVSFCRSPCCRPSCDASFFNSA